MVIYTCAFDVKREWIVRVYEGLLDKEISREEVMDHGVLLRSDLTINEAVYVAAAEVLLARRRMTLEDIGVTQDSLLQGSFGSGDSVEADINTRVLVARWLGANGEKIEHDW